MDICKQTEAKKLAKALRGRGIKARAVSKKISKRKTEHYCLIDVSDEPDILLIDTYVLNVRKNINFKGDIKWRHYHG